MSSSPDDSSTKPPDAAAHTRRATVASSGSSGFASSEPNILNNISNEEQEQQPQQPHAAQRPDRRPDRRSALSRRSSVATLQSSGANGPPGLSRSVFASFQSGGIAKGLGGLLQKQNSIVFRPNNAEWDEDSSVSESGDASVGTEIIDLRPSMGLEDLEDDSLVSLGDCVSLDSEGIKAASGMFLTKGNNHPKPGINKPKHWAPSPPEDDDSSYNALMKLMHGKTRRGGTGQPRDRHLDGSFVSSGSVSSSRASSRSSSRLITSSSSAVSGVSPLTRERRLRRMRKRQRRLYARRCVTLLVATAVAFLRLGPEGHRESVKSLLPDNSWLNEWYEHRVKGQQRTEVSAAAVSAVQDTPEAERKLPQERWEREEAEGMIPSNDGMSDDVSLKENRRRQRNQLRYLRGMHAKEQDVARALQAPSFSEEAAAFQGFQEAYHEQQRQQQQQQQQAPPSFPEGSFQQAFEEQQQAAFQEAFQQAFQESFQEAFHEAFQEQSFAEAFQEVYPEESYPPEQRRRMAGLEGGQENNQFPNQEIHQVPHVDQQWNNMQQQQQQQQQGYDQQYNYQHPSMRKRR